MKLLVFTKEEGPESRAALEVAGVIESEGYEVEKYNLEEEEAISRSEIYDLYSNPAFVVVAEDGRMIEKWQGEVPTRSELIHFIK